MNQRSPIQVLAKAESRFGIIEALVFPERFQEIWRMCGGRKLAVVHQLATEHARAARTIRHWMRQYELYGVKGLVNKARSDKGSTRAKGAMA